MGYRNIFVSSSAKLSCKNNQLIVQADDTFSIPIEDINCLMLEDLKSNISVYLLSALSEKGVTVFVCDQKHLPCGLLLPMWSHSRKLKVLKKQLNQKKPFIKQLWKDVVQTKIENQAICLKLLNKDGSIKLLDIKENVKSGDVDNAEGRAARYYFSKLFGNEFYRGIDSTVNASLNYGYAILRGCMARQLASYGFEPSLGIFHHNEQNSFNLADDLMEPFRPIVDLFVGKNISYDNEADLKPAIKHQLFNLLNCSVESGNQIHSVSYAIERTVKSLTRTLEEGTDELLLPRLIGLRQHSYE
ncbi:type II CRISPR-associated endonuclease Cas1 [Alkalibacter mobilis]|uniref:type II CRISPR-associated endonuclease Cas1 n=1 Tax=Alkalibacter mobilis TaxID=2787712 RepID=UPI00189FF60C|nr:type II CRISPR-associated endonuclease Cas1 [Alkalibacter mobilis]MBF7097243.1 type II CRISPR-associated endonuclease Cas1 [Alkalibacter mobilis]